MSPRSQKVVKVLKLRTREDLVRFFAIVCAHFDGISTATEATHFHVWLTLTQVSRKRSRRVTGLLFCPLCVRKIP
jgi:hypothetical protein